MLDVNVLFFDLFYTTIHEKTSLFLLEFIAQDLMDLIGAKIYSQECCGTFIGV